MATHQIVNQSLPISEVEEDLASLIDRVARDKTRVVVERDGMSVAGIVSTDDLRRLDRLDRERAERFAVIDEVRDPVKDVPPEEIERETDRIIARLRAEDAQRTPLVADRQ